MIEPLLFQVVLTEAVQSHERGCWKFEKTEKKEVQRRTGKDVCYNGVQDNADMLNWNSVLVMNHELKKRTNKEAC